MTPPIFRRRRQPEKPAGDTSRPTIPTPPRATRVGRFQRTGDEPQTVPETPTPSPEAEFLVRRALPQWREVLATGLGSSALTNIGELEEAALDLTNAHPAGIARLYAAQPTSLSLLLREGHAYSRGRRNAIAVVERAEKLASQHGGASLYLAIGVATWSELRDVTPVPTPASAATTHNEADTSAVADGNEDEPANDDAGQVQAEASDDHDADTPEEPGTAEPVSTEPELREFSAPILLRPVRIHIDPQTDGAIDISLEPGIEINPALIAALRKAGAQLNEAEIAQAQMTDHGFTPRPALHAVVEAAQRHLQGFHYDERLIIAPFINPGQLLLADVEALEEELPTRLFIAAIAGESIARKRLAQPLPPVAAGDRAPDAERGVGDLSPAQQAVVETAASRRSFMVDVAPGASETDVIAAVIADAAASGLHVALVSGNVRRAQANIATLQRHGLEDIVLDFTGPQWRTTALERLRSGFVEYEDTLDDAAIINQRKALLEARGTLDDYFAALHRPHEPWDVSAHLALQELARITSLRPAARTDVRFDDTTLRQLVPENREALIEVLEEAADKGIFTLRR
ncbi:MAG: hypothetical protein Q4Q03_02865, partial [Bowdeniella nasicola]|nr:hypothetical protein [Bowdeniella nasicola]